MVEPLGPCVVWTGALSRGYGHRRVVKNGRATTERMHRVVWEEANGPIPDGYEPDHLCENKACHRLSHLELVTHAENIRRYYERHPREKATHCEKGHPFAGKHLYVPPSQPHRNTCRTCRTDYMRGYRALQRSRKGLV